MRFITDFLARLWRLANFWRVSPVEGVRTGSALAGGLLFLFMLFVIVGVALTMLGFDLGEVDLWLDSQGRLIDLIAQILFRGLLAIIFLMCLAVIVTVVVTPFLGDKTERPGWGMLIGAAIIAWFVGVTLFAPLDPY